MQIVVPEEFKYLYNGKGKILTIPHDALRQKAAAISKVSKKTQLIIDDMLREMRLANGVGLAAPQMGVSQRIVVIAPLDHRPTALVNPRIIKAEGEVVGEEGCLSIPGLYGDVKRAESIVVEAWDRKGRGIELDLEGMPARIVQHEIDHLDGILFIDKVDLATLHWMHPESIGALEA